MSPAYRPPNILLITTDEQRYDTLGVTSNPYVRTPNLDRLAARGTLFTHGYIQNPVCVPSRASIQTGRYVHQHGVDHMEEVIATTPGLPPWETTFMERLQAAGYATAAFGKIHMLPPKGFDELQLTMGKGARWTVAEGSPLGPSQLGPVYAAWLERKRPGAYEAIYAQRRQPEYRNQLGAIANVLAADEYVDYWIAQSTREYLARPHDRPFFVWCGFCGPHPPFDPPEPYASLYPIDQMPVPPLLRARKRNVPDLSVRGADAGDNPRPSRFDRPDGDRLAQKLLAHYWGMVTFIDDMVGRIADVMTGRNLWQNTLVVFTTDHGAMMGDFGLTGKGNFTEQVIRVPYIVVPPGSPPALTPRPPLPISGEGAPVGGGEGPRPRVYGRLVEHVDLAPTILDYAGLPKPGELPGRSLRPVLEGTGDLPPLQSILCDHVVGRDARAPTKCLRTERCKYVFSGADRPVEFYDLEADPLELVNVADRYRAEVGRHAELLLHRLAHTEHNPWNSGLAARTPPALDPFGLPVQPPK